MRPSSSNGAALRLARRLLSYPIAMRTPIALALGSLAVLVASGCGSGGASSTPPPGGRPGATFATGPTTTSGTSNPTGGPGSGSGTTPARWWKGDLHVHSLHSGDGFDTVAQTLALAAWKKLDFVVLSDHDTLTQQNDPDFSAATSGVVPLAGCEWTEIAHGGLIGPSTVPSKFSPQDPPASLTAGAQARIDEAHREGAAFVLNHPLWHMFPWILPVREFDGIEIWNSFWTVSDIGLHPSTTTTLRQRLDAKGFTAAGLGAPPEIVRATNRVGSENDQALFFWEEMLEQGRRVAAVGGSDRHRFLLPGYPTTWVLAPGTAQAEVAAAIRAGRTIVTDGPEGPRVTFEADGDGDGVFESTIGDEVPVLRPVALRVRVEGAKDGLVRVIRRRAIALQEKVTTADYSTGLVVTPQPGDWFRVDVFQEVDWSIPGASQLIPQIATGLGGAASQLSVILSGFGVGVAIGTNQPVVDFDSRYLRVLNVDLSTAPTFDYSRAAVTSAIWAR